MKNNFKHMCFLHMQRLTNFPYIEADFDALTNYELLCKIVEYLNKVIANENAQNDAINELADAFNSLKSYVDNYFDNLDVQEEINNKLDDMAESGQLTDIIAQYLGLAGMITFNTVNDMKEAQNLVNGSKCSTLGFHSVNDGGNAVYKIRTITNDDVVDEMTIIALYDNSLIAELIINDTMSPEQFGAYGDGTNNDTQAIQKALDSNCNICFNRKTYLADNLNAPEKSIINGNNCTIKASNSSNTILTINRDSTIENINVEGVSINELSATGIKFSNLGYRINLNNVSAKFCDYGISDTNGIWSVTSSKIWVVSCEHGLHITHGSSTSFSLNNFVHENCGSPLYVKYLNYSNFGTIYGDYANGGEESSWAYPKGFGARNDYVYKFEGCKGLNIESLGGENNIGVACTRILYSNIKINNVYIVRHKSYDTSANRALFSLDSSLSIVDIGSFICYGNPEDANTIYDYYYDFPYDVGTYGQQKYTLLSYVVGELTARTPKEVCKRNSTTELSSGYLNLDVKEFGVNNKTMFSIEYVKSPNFNLPICQNIEITLMNNASSCAVIKGEVNASIIINNNMQGMFSFKQQINNETAFTDLTVTKTANKISIPIPSGMRVAWVKFDSLGSRLNYNYYFE